MMTLTENLFTQSEITVHDLCHRRWYFQYAKNLKLKGMWSWAFEVGSEVHRVMEKFYRGDKVNKNFNPVICPDIIRNQAFDEKLEFWQIFFPAWMESYLLYKPHFPGKVLEVEKLVVRELHGLKLTGKIDIVGDTFYADHKTMSNMEIFGDQLLTRFQFLFYFFLTGKTSGNFVVNKIKKPALRKKQSESNAEFAQRCVSDVIERREEYFQKETITFSEEIMENFEKKVLLPKVIKLQKILERDEESKYLWLDMNLNSCYNYNTPCPFLELCHTTGGAKLIPINYVNKTSKHEELEND